MNNEEINRIRELASRATPGPWNSDPQPGEFYICGGEIVNDIVKKAVTAPKATEIQLAQPNMDFIAAANPTAILSLAQALLDAREENERLKALATTQAGKYKDEILEVSKLKSSNAHLQSQLTEALRVIEFYGDEKNWTIVSDRVSPQIVGDARHADDSKGCAFTGHKRAREFLAKVKGRV